MIVMQYDPVDAVRCIRDNLRTFEDEQPDAARHGLYRLVAEQVRILQEDLAGSTDWSGRHLEPNDATPREAAEIIRANLRQHQKDVPAAQEDGSFCLALVQLGVLIERLPERDPATDPYRDTKSPLRDCDCCGMPYQGPAVYCSRVCAYQDSF